MRMKGQRRFLTMKKNPQVESQMHTKRKPLNINFRGHFYDPIVCLTNKKKEKNPIINKELSFYDPWLGKS